MKKSINTLKGELEEMKLKAPRVGVIHTKIVPDKTKYDRKRIKREKRS